MLAVETLLKALADATRGTVGLLPSSGSDPVLRTIREAVTHALGHVESIRRDAERLHKKTGCCVPATEIESRLL